MPKPKARFHAEYRPLEVTELGDEEAIHLTGSYSKLDQFIKKHRRKPFSVELARKALGLTFADETTFRWVRGKLGLMPTILLCLDDTDCFNAGAGLAADELSQKDFSKLVAHAKERWPRWEKSPERANEQSCRAFIFSRDPSFIDSVLPSEGPLSDDYALLACTSLDADRAVNIFQRLRQTMEFPISYGEEQYWFRRLGPEGSAKLLIAQGDPQWPGIEMISSPELAEWMVKRLDQRRHRRVAREHLLRFPDIAVPMLSRSSSPEAAKVLAKLQSTK